MPGTRLPITGKDREALESFFNNKKEFDETKSLYMDLGDYWKSLTDISTELNEPRKRTTKRLDKLTSFGLVEVESVSACKRVDHYWRITNAGIYYMLSILERPKLIRFLQSNNKKIEEFRTFEKMLHSSSLEFDILIRQIRNYSKNHQYHEIMNFVMSWTQNVFGKTFRKMLLPNFKETMKRKYEIKTIKELEKTYGKIL